MMKKIKIIDGKKLIFICLFKMVVKQIYNSFLTCSVFNKKVITFVKIQKK